MVAFERTSTNSGSYLCNNTLELIVSLVAHFFFFLYAGNRRSIVVFKSMFWPGDNVHP